MGGATIFQDFDDILSAAVQAGTGNVIARVLGGMAVDVTLLITLSILILGVMMAFRQHDYWAGVAQAGRMFTVSMLVGGGWYVLYFQQPFLVVIPNSIAALLSGAQGPNAQGQQFDLVFSAIKHVAAGILAVTSVSPKSVAQALIAFWATMAAGFFLGIVFAVWEMAKVLCALVLIGGAFLVGMLLFQATRPVFFRFVDKLIGLMLLDAMMAGLIQFILFANGTYMKRAQDINAGVDVQVMVLINMCLFAWISAAVAVMVPAVAAYIGGGVGIDTRQITTQAMRAAARGARMAQSAVRSGARGVGVAR